MHHVLTPDEERRLLQRCRSGDQDAWAEFYTTYGPAVARFLRRIVGPDPDFDDLVQQVFVECFTSLDRFRGDARVSTWLYGIASHVAGKAHRSASRRRRRVEALAEHVGALGATSASDSHGQVAARGALADLDRILAAMKPKHRLVWVMVEVEGLSHSDVARALGLRPGTVRSRLSRARERVLTGLRKRGHALDAVTSRPPREVMVGAMAGATHGEEVVDR